MRDHLPPEAEPGWAARSGKRFFFLWMAGLIVQAIAMRLLWMASSGWGSTAPGANVQGLMVLVAVLAHFWQGWLLFRLNWRAAVWGLLPLVSLVAPGNVRWIQLQGVVAPLIETPLLVGVRLRPWAWLLAGMGQVIFSAIVAAAGSGFIAALSSRVPGVAPQSAWMAVSSGAWLLGEAVAAAILAWWMPPLTRESRTEPPPPSGSTAG